MKKLLFISCLFIFSISALADGEKKIDASKVQKITFNGDNIVIQYNDGSETTTMDMAEVVIEFGTSSGIEERLTTTRKAGIEGKAIYNLKGQHVGNSAARLQKGTYIIDKKKVVIK